MIWGKGGPGRGNRECKVLEQDEGDMVEDKREVSVEKHSNKRKHGRRCKQRISQELDHSAGRRVWV